MTCSFVAMLCVLIFFIIPVATFTPVVFVLTFVVAFGIIVVAVLVHVFLLFKLCVLSAFQHLLLLMQ
jgi:hypothetical protein